MFSQSLFAQLIRMFCLLALSLIAVHNCKPLLDLLASQAIGSGCHQQSSHHINESEPYHSHHQH
ncbi:hypothetical protein [Thalassotalea aquiviva]|uniref:hypothetical protein n=1 Tax=Thalassotalea aquiviva TaxID=3242415 RepID=UPI00352B1A45